MDVAGIAQVTFIVHRAQMLVLHHFGKAHDGVQRRAQLVAHIGQEGRLGAIGIFGLVHRHSQAAGHDVHVRPALLQLLNHVAGIEDDRRGDHRDVDGDVDQGVGPDKFAFRGMGQVMNPDRRQHGHAGQRCGGAEAAKPRQLDIQPIEHGPDPRDDVFKSPVHLAPPAMRKWYARRGCIAVESDCAIARMLLSFC